MIFAKGKNWQIEGRNLVFTSKYTVRRDLASQGANRALRGRAVIGS
jgi:hypothetical protein